MAQGERQDATQQPEQSPDWRPQRLAVFLDGTWNRRDDSTNVRHGHTLTVDGVVSDGFLQRRYYESGVGTGVLDGVTGGGFGLGLEDKVRDAYNWLSEYYNDGDEIYVFGFSRGAYTARSLVGFIAKVGLVKRGAPLTVNQLWKTYTLLAQGTSEVQALRQISKAEAKANPDEGRLKHWSRRVEVTYLGIYDTVGAMGLDALAFPGLRGKLARDHDMRYSSIIGASRHALAIDEHRSSFLHTPLSGFWSSGMSESEAEKYARRFEGSEQRWFVGAHSNVGGGYSDNPLASTPLKWVLEGANARGLRTHPFEPKGDDERASERRDSFYDFLGKSWAEVIRSKRHYRQLAPPADVRGAPPNKRHGYALIGVNEDVHESVFDLAENEPAYAPPNLIEYAKRNQGESPRHAALATRKSPHRWVVTTGARAGVLLLWATLAGAGLGAVIGAFFGAVSLGIAVAPVVAALLVLIDWYESRCAHAESLDRNASFPAAARGALIWPRLLGSLCAVVGALVVLCDFWSAGWGASSLGQGYEHAWTAVSSWAWGAPAALAALFAVGAGGRALGGVVAAAGLAVLGGLLVLASWWLGRATGAAAEPIASAAAALPVADQIAGRLAILGLGIVLLMTAFRWTAQPLERGNLGSITRLQKAFSPKAVRAVLEDWAGRLRRNWVTPDEVRDAAAIVDANTRVRTNLWRDSLVLVPAYSQVFALALWIATQHQQLDLFGWCPWLQAQGDALGRPALFGAPLWVWIVVGTAVADQIENAVHRGYLRSTPAAWRVWLGAVATVLKTIGFVVQALATALVFLALVWALFQQPTGGWRWMVVSSIGAIVIASTMATVVGLIVQRIRRAA